MPDSNDDSYSPEEYKALKEAQATPKAPEQATAQDSATAYGAAPSWAKVKSSLFEGIKGRTPETNPSLMMANKQLLSPIVGSTLVSAGLKSGLLAKKYADWTNGGLVAADEAATGAEAASAGEKAAEAAEEGGVIERRLKQLKDWAAPAIVTWEVGRKGYEGFKKAKEMAFGK